VREGEDISCWCCLGGGCGIMVVGVGGGGGGEKASPNIGR